MPLWRAAGSHACYVTGRAPGLPNAEDVREGLIVYKIAAHAADIIATVRELVIGMMSSVARHNFDRNKQFELSLDPERAKEYHDETLPADIYKQAEFCSCATEALPDAPRSPMQT